MLRSIAGTERKEVFKKSLLAAVKSGDLEKCRELLLRQDLPTGRSLLRSTHDEEGVPPLHLACKYGHLPLVELLMDAGAEPSEMDRDPKRRGPAISYAAWGGHLDIIDYLVTHGGATLDEVDVVGNTPMLYAIYGGHRSVVDALMKRGRSLYEINDKLHSALLQASCGGHTELVEWLIDKGFSLDDTDSDGNTALLFAAWGGFLDTMVLLLDRGAKLTERNNNGHTVLLSAANGGRIEVVKWLLSRGFCLDEKNNNGDTCLLLAAYGGHVELVAWLFEHGVSPTEKNNCGFTPLLSAANGGQLEMVRWLIENGAKIGEADEDGYTPLILAACGGSVKMVAFFLSLGALVTETNDNGDTPLLLAAYCGHTELIQWLLDNGAKLSERNNTLMGPLISASNGGSVDAVQLLLRRIAEAGPGCGDSMENTDQGGYTPLLLAAQRGHKRIVHLLATHGGNLKAMTNRNQADAALLATPEVREYLSQITDMTPLEIAADAGDVDRVHSLVVEATTAELQLAQGKLMGCAGSLEDLTPAGRGPLARIRSGRQTLDEAGFTSDSSPASSPSATRRAVGGGGGGKAASDPLLPDSPSRSLHPAHRLIRQALKPWAPTRHYLFGITTRRQVFNLFMVHSKLQKTEVLPHLPKEIWLEIASFFGRAADTDPEKEAPPRRMAMYGFPIGLSKTEREIRRQAAHSARTSRGRRRDDVGIPAVQKRLIY